jgi:ribonuclease P protein component
MSEIKHLENAREADLSTQQARAQAPPRLSRPYGHQWWCQGHRGSPPPWPQAPLGLIAHPARRLAVQADSMDRLKKRRDFLKVQKGRRVHSGLFSVQVLRQDQAGPSRAGFTVSKKVSPRAVKRNRIRRRLKEALRQTGVLLPQSGLDVVIVAREDALTAGYDRIISELSRLLRKATNDTDAGHRSAPAQ